MMFTIFTVSKLKLCQSYQNVTAVSSVFRKIVKKVGQGDGVLTPPLKLDLNSNFRGAFYETLQEISA